MCEGYVFQFAKTQKRKTGSDKQKRWRRVSSPPPVILELPLRLQSDAQHRQHIYQFLLDGLVALDGIGEGNIDHLVVLDASARRLRNQHHR